MKGLAKPISSPSRVDSFPPPLLGFLKSNGSSRSRGRCRSSPIFIQRKKRESTQAIVTQEPSSPKVTCMGQVRVRRSKQAGKKNRKKKKNNPIDKSGYQWIHKTLFCCHFNENLKPKTKTSKKPCCGKWVFPISRKKLEIKEESTEIEANIEDFEELEGTTEEEEEEEEEKAEVFIGTSPPKNALLLMRCRSEPYRASSLANQFWGSPSLTNQEEEEDEERQCQTEQKHIEEEDEEVEEEPTLEKEPSNCRDSAAELRINPETEEKMGFCQGFERSSSITSTKTCTNIEAETSKIPSSSRPPLLTRCKSEPARRSEKFQVQTCFWKKRFEFVDISTTRF